MAEMMQSLGQEFITRLVSVVKESLADSIVGAEDGANPLDAFAPDTASLQAQLQAMNKNGASSNSVAPFNEIEVTGVV